VELDRRRERRFMTRSDGCGEGLHVAVIMDGNGRWAQARGLPRRAGHAAGAAAVEPLVRAAPSLGIGRLTLFALSSDNWNRPAEEVAAILDLVKVWLDARVDMCIEEGVRVSVIGRRDRFPNATLEAVERAERMTASGDVLHLRIAIDYSARDAIVNAARAFHVGVALEGGREGFGRVLSMAMHAGPRAHDVDLLVRSGGEQRLSDFLLWECAYAELVFSTCLWPEFGVTHLEEAVAEFKKRERRFGLLPSMDNAASDDQASESVAENDVAAEKDTSHAPAEAVTQPLSAKDAM
jgi:undecaprenyl diphosphate synthase